VAEIDRAIAYIDEPTTPLSSAIKMALKSRLSFRAQFLTEISRSIEDLVQGKSNWDGCISLLSTIGITRNQGIPVPEAFSTSVQRKLASTVPPRPLVVTPFEEAFTILSRLCKDAKEILKVLEYKGATDLVVSFCVVLLGTQLDYLLIERGFRPSCYALWLDSLNHLHTSDHVSRHYYSRMMSC